MSVHFPRQHPLWLLPISMLLVCGLVPTASAAAGDRSALANTTAASVILVSISEQGTQSEGSSGLPPARPVLSAHGRFVVFGSNDPNLVEPDANALADVYLRDTVEGSTALVSVANAEAQGGGAGTISSDGHSVAFLSRSDQFSPNDTNGDRIDVFVRDMLTGEVSLVSVSSDGEQRNLDSQDAVISGDGSRVAFSTAARLSKADNDEAGVEEFKRIDVYVHNMVTGATRLVSVNGQGDNFTGPVALGGISYDGRTIGFTWGNPGRHRPDVPAGLYVRNMGSRGSQLIWEEVVLAGAVPSNAGAPAISGNGRYAAFASDSPRIDSDPVYPLYDVARYDRKTGDIAVVSKGINSRDAHGDSFAPTLSYGGRYLGFASEADNLVRGDGNEWSDAFRYSFATGRLQLASAGTAGAGNAPSAFGGGVAISADGQHLAFHSYASNLAVDDPDQLADVFEWTAAG